MDGVRNCGWEDVAERGVCRLEVDVVLPEGAVGVDEKGVARKEIKVKNSGCKLQASILDAWNRRLRGYTPGPQGRGTGHPAVSREN